MPEIIKFTDGNCIVSGNAIIMSGKVLEIQNLPVLATILNKIADHCQQVKFQENITDQHRATADEIFHISSRGVSAVKAGIITKKIMESLRELP